jgi:radical SAM superfamily enzyme YgiQ (UPF0313 family)
MKLCFVNISLRPGAVRRQLPVGLAYVMTAVKKAGFDFDLIDMDINSLSMEDMDRILSEKHYDVFAFGCIVSGFRHAKRLSEIIRKHNPKAVIIAGNSVSAAVPALSLNRTEVDICVMGEGDFTMVELLDALQRKEDISKVEGIAYLQGGKILFTHKREFNKDLDIYGFPDWEIFDLPKYEGYASVNVNQFGSDKVLSYPLTTCRGCPHSCTFCYITVRDEKIRYRRYSEKAVMEEVRRLHVKHKADYISFWDDFSFPTQKSVRERIESFNNLDFKIRWDAPIRTGLFKKGDEAILRELKDSGCDNLSFSLENADEAILKAINKKISVSDFIEQCHTLRDAGITPLTSVIFGYPQETMESIKKTIDVCAEAGVFPSVGYLLPLPGTQIYEWAKDSGKITDDYDFLMRIGDRQDFHINLTNLPDDVLTGEVTERLQELARQQGLELKSVFKTGVYKKPESASPSGK